MWGYYGKYPKGPFVVTWNMELWKPIMYKTVLDKFSEASLEFILMKERISWTSQHND